MSTSTVPSPFSLRGKAHAKVRARSWPRPELLGLLVLAAVLDLWALDLNGYANDYYSAAVRSMSTSWHAFLYGSFDVGGVMTVDKPPLANWIQALSVRVFGFNSWAMLVPQALMGVATVGLVYDIARRTFGRWAGFAAGLTLALTPVAVAISRHNNPDALLILCSVAGIWCLVRALDGGQLRWLVWCGVAVGLGFEAKMAAALLVVPGIVAAYLWIAPKGRLVALRQLAVGGAAMLVVGLAWPVLMWLTPAADRPWVSGTSDNSIWSLILGYNGLGRVFGQDGGPGGGAGGGPGGGGGGGGVFGGDTGPLRLLNEALGGQAGWLLGLAAVAGVAILAATRLKRTDARTGWLIAVGGTFAITAITFSKAQGIFHPYYVSALAPFTALLVGAGAVTIARGGTLMRVFGPLAVAAGVAAELVVLHRSATDMEWIAPVLITVGAVVAIVLALGLGDRWRAIAVATALGFLLIAPGAWAVQTLGHATSSTFPAGGPASAGGMGGPGGGGPGGGGGRGMRGGQGLPGGAPPTGAGAGAQTGGGIGGPPAAGATTGGTTGTQTGGPLAMTGGGGNGARPPGGGMFGGDTQSLNAALAYAKAHGGGTVAVSSQSGAAGSLISSGANVAAIGGFSGRESQVTTAWLADAVDAGQIRWVLADSSGGGMGQDGRVGAQDVMTAVQSTCKEVSSVSGLYDCQGATAALRAAS